MGLKSDGGVVAVGNNTYGQCNVETWTDIREIVVAGYRTVGLKHDGSVVAVGKNDGEVVFAGSNSCGQCDPMANLGQETGQIEGKIVDLASSSPIADATIHVGDSETHANSDGNYWIYVEPGSHDAEYSNAGYQSVIIPGITVDSDSPITIDIEMSAPGDLEIVTIQLSGANIGYAYNDRISIRGGIWPCTWSLDSGALPEGLSLDVASGQLHGISNAEGTFSFTVRVTDSAANAVSRAYALDVVPVHTIAGVIAEGATIPVMLSGQQASDTITDDQGNFVFTQLENGTYQVTPNHPYYEFNPPSVAIVLDNQNATGVSFSFVENEPLCHTTTPQIAAGSLHALGLRACGSVLAVGGDDDGQLQVGDWSDIVQVAAGGYHSLGLKADGSVVSAGSNGDGQCNVGDWVNISKISAGESHSVAIKTDGTMVATGKNDYSQCNVAYLKGISQIATGYAFTVAMKDDSSIVTVGANGYAERRFDHNLKHYGAVTGMTVHASTGDPIADVKIEDASGSSHSQMDGCYCRGLTPGTYDLVFRKTGFQTVSKPDIAVGMRDVIDLDIEMAPATSYAGIWSDAAGVNAIRSEGRFVHAVSDDAYHIIDISDPNDPREFGSCSTGGTLLAVGDQNAAIADQGRLHIVDISDRGNPRPVLSFQDDFEYRSIQIEDGKLYLLILYHYANSTEPGLIIAEFMDGGGINVLSSITWGSFQWSSTDDIAVKGDRALVVDSYDRGMDVYDVSDPCYPSRIGGIFCMDCNSEYRRYLDVNGSYAYATGTLMEGGTSTGSLMTIVDITDVDSPDIASMFDFHTVGERKLIGRNGYVYSMLGDEAIRIVDVADPYSPVESDQKLTNTDHLKDIEANNRYILAAGKLGIHIHKKVDYERYVDTDGDGIDDNLENAGCTLVNDPDTDDDRVPDGMEDDNRNGNKDTGETDPCDADTDDDGISDGNEDSDHDGIVDAGETDPRNPDTDEDGVFDGTEIGLTLPQISEATDLSAGYFIADADPTTTTDPLDNDSDDDGQLDGEEDSDGNGRVDDGESDPNEKPVKALPFIPLLLLGD